MPKCPGCDQECDDPPCQRCLDVAIKAVLASAVKAMEEEQQQEDKEREK